MSLESTPAVEATATGSETTPSSPAETSTTKDRYEGIFDMDAPEPVEAKPEQTVEVPTGEEPIEAGTEDAIDDDASAPDPWEGYEDIEIDGEVVKVPAKYKDGYLRQADYTRKTQEVAARSKELETREAQIIERQKLSEGEIDAYVALSRVGERLREFENIDWNAEFARTRAADDPIALGDLNAKWAQFQGLRSLQQEGVAYINEAATKRTEWTKQETAKRLAATKAFAEKNIKGWNPELDHKITNWAIEQGFDRDTLVNAYNPQVYSIMHKAFQWDQSIKRQQTARPTPQTAPPTQPTKTVSAKASAMPTPDLNSLSMSDYVKYRGAGKT